MYKKWILIGLIVAAISTLLVYSNLYISRIENEKVRNDLNSKINELTQSRQELEDKINELTKNIQTQKKQEAPKGSLQLVSAVLQSNEAYNEGVNLGSIYGAFNVVAKVKNISDHDISNIKVTSIFVKNSTGEVNMGVNAKAQRIDTLTPGEEKEITFSGFQVDNPDISQEVIVNVFHPTIEVNDVSNIKKINLKVAFPPA